MRNNEIERMTKDEIAALFAERKARYVTAAFIDLQGQLRGKTMRAQKLLSGLDSGIPFSPYNHMMDFGDIALPPRGYLSGDIAIEDNLCDVVPASRTLPFEDRDADQLFFVEFQQGTRGHDWDPRVAYRRAEKRLLDVGLKPTHSFEYEFRVFEESIRTARDKGFQKLQLISETSNYGGVMHQGVHAELFKDLRGMCDRLEVPIESIHWEVAAGLAEVALSHQPGIKAADDAVLFKTHAKVSAQRHDSLITFMARPFDDADGQSGHVHLSLLDERGKPVFHDRRGRHTMSRIQRHYIGGLQRLMPELLLLLAPNINSFKRFVPGIFAPIAANWGVDNRTCAIRVIEGKPNAQRVEVRVAGSDANPYLVLAALHAAGAHGIANKIDPSPPQEGSSYVRARDIPAELRFPRTFQEAIDQFRTSKFARKLWTDDFVEMFAGTRQAQADQFTRFVTDRERMRFLELA